MASSLQPVALHSTAQAITKGERHCGTNFIDAVLRHNFGDGAVHAWTDHSNTVYSGCDIKEQPRLALTDGGHAGPDSRYYCCAKHGVPSTACVWPHAAPVAGVVFLMRSPYAWIPEMRASPYGAVRVKQYPNFSWFLHSPFPDYVNIKFGDASPGHHIMHATPMAMWSSKVGACRRYASQAAVAGGPAGVFVSYTDLFNASALAAKLVPALAAWGFPSRRHANATYNKASDDGGTASAPQQGADEDEDEDEGVVAADGFELPLDAEAKATDNNKMTEEARRAADATTTLHGSSPCAPLHSPCHARALSATPSPHPRPSLRAPQFTLEAWKALRGLESKHSTWMQHFCAFRWEGGGGCLRDGQADLDFFNAAIPDADLQLFGMPRVRTLELSASSEVAEAMAASAHVDDALFERAARAFDGDDV